jgi:hypothetical protein
MAGASPSPAVRPVAHVLISAVRALHNSIRPTLRDKVSSAVIGVGKVYDRFLKALRFVAHGALHELNSRLPKWWSQGNYCPAKERQLKIDLKEKDRQIALATQGAATATEQSDKAELAASKAQQNLAGANERAADAEERAATAQLGAENAKKSAPDAMIGQQRVEIELDKQRERAAIAERRLLELQQTLADRSLTDLQLKRIADKLRFSGGQEYEVIAYWDSPESVGIANRISQALQLAQWKLVTPKAWKGLMGGMVGVKVSLHPEADEQTRIAADNLVTALNAEGIQSSKELQNPTNNPSNNMISLSVGSKR